MSDYDAWRAAHGLEDLTKAKKGGLKRAVWRNRVGRAAVIAGGATFAAGAVAGARGHGKPPRRKPAGQTGGGQFSASGGTSTRSAVRGSRTHGGPTTSRQTRRDDRRWAKPGDKANRERTKRKKASLERYRSGKTRSDLPVRPKNPNLAPAGRAPRAKESRYAEAERKLLRTRRGRKRLTEVRLHQIRRALRSSGLR